MVKLQFYHGETAVSFNREQDETEMAEFCHLVDHVSNKDKGCAYNIKRALCIFIPSELFW